jgi:hypothetical protein
MYEGELILKKHSMYHEFLRIASAEERSYHAFAAIRNPMDEAVSVYFKYKTDHDGQFSKALVDGGVSVSRRDLDRFKFIKQTNATFAEYFERFPYDNWSRLAHRNFDLVSRFENLQADFSKMLEIAGVKQLRDLPQKNDTGMRDKRYLEQFTDATIPRARRVFGPFMDRWGYELPSEWAGPSLLGKIQFSALAPARWAYWGYLRGSSGWLGQLLRRWLGFRRDK